MDNNVEELRYHGYTILDRQIDVRDILSKFHSLFTEWPVPLAHRYWNQADAGDKRCFVDPAFFEDELFEPTKIIDEICSVYMGHSSRTAVYMANRVQPSLGQVGSGGGWHRDSYRRQIKCFIYLSEVTISNGPLAYIPKSHKARNKMLNLAKSSELKRARYTAERDMQYFNDCSQPLTGSVGTVVLADTSGIHQGMPVFNGERLMLTQYRYPQAELSRQYRRFLL
jgi:hypothetical protein